MSEAMSWMMDCHARIRSFSAGLLRLAALDDLCDPRAPQAAAQAARYFGEGLPLHGQDEDLSLKPRLCALGLDEQALAELERMSADHHEMDSILPDLLARLAEISAGTPPAPALLREPATRLCALLLDHIDREERLIFPLAARLGPADHAAMFEEMRARRGLGPSPV